MQIFKYVKSFSRSAVVLSLALMPLSAFATQTLKYNCSAMNYDSATRTGYVYIFEAVATQGSEGGPFIRPGTILSVNKFVGDLYSDDAIVEPLVSNEVLQFDGAGTSWIAYSLASSVYGLSVNFYPNATDVYGEKTGYVILFHTIAPGNTLVSQDELTHCVVSGI